MINAKKSEERPIGVEERGDEPRMSDNGPRGFEQQHLQARPARDREHGGQDDDKKSTKEPDHDKNQRLRLLARL